MPKTIEYKTSVEVTQSPEVLVTGGGIAGVCAAVAAARTGAKTLLVERLGMLGGDGTAGGVSIFMNWKSGEKSLCGGLFQEILDRLAKKNAIIQNAFHPEGMKQVLLEMLVDSKVQLVFHSQVVDAVVENNRVDALIFSGKSKLFAITPKIVVDATGDGDVAYYSGVPYEKGKHPTGELQAMTLMFRIGGVEIDKTIDDVAAAPEQFFKWSTKTKGASRASIAGYFDLTKKGQEEGTYPKPIHQHIFFYSTLIPGEVELNTTHVPGLDGSTGEGLTTAEVDARYQAWMVWNFLRDNVAGFKNSFITTTAPQIGVRETRRITGEYVFSGQDVINAKKFDDGIACGNYPIDLHDEESQTFMSGGPKPGDYYHIPYRCLVPLKIDNMLIAGRCISSTREGQGAMRIMPIVAVVGHAAGAAAALCIKNKITPRGLITRVEELRQVLKQQHAVL
ncbi:MAG: FAD-dependent oxidoreductase [Elusimicrobiota bacterium]